MFDCSRLPGMQNTDWSTAYVHGGKHGDMGHIIVMRCGGVWKVDMCHENRILTTGELYQCVKLSFRVCSLNQNRIFEEIYIKAKQQEFSPVNILGACNRDNWAKVSRTSSVAMHSRCQELRKTHNQL